MSSTQTIRNVHQLVDDMFSGKWQNPIHQRFKEQAESAGFEVQDYHGRFGYYGPAVIVNDNDKFVELLGQMRTQIKLQWDDFGKTGKIVYPK